MADIVTVQELKDAGLDANSLAKFINGSDSDTVLTRLNIKYPTLKKAIKELFEKGGLPATPFATKALMTASTLADGDYAMVTDDAVNNGLYVKKAGAWVKSAYEPVSTHTTTLGGVTAEYIDMANPSYTAVNMTAISTPQGIVWRESSTTESIIIPVTENTVYLIKPRRENAIKESLLVFYNSEKTALVNGEFLSSDTSVFVYDKNQDHLVSVPTGSNRMLLMTVFQGYRTKPNSIIKVSNALISTGDVIDSVTSNESKLPVSARVVKNINDDLELVKKDVIKTDAYDVVYGSDVTYIDGFTIIKDKVSPSGYSWYKKEDEKIAVMPISSKTMLKIKAKKYQISIISFFNEIPTPNHYYHILNGSVNVVPENTEINVTVPSYAKYMLINTMSSGNDLRPDKLQFVNNRALASNDVIDTLPKYGSAMPVSANVVLELQEQIYSGKGKEIPMVINVGQKTSVFATHKNFILKDELVDGVSHIMVSRDLGVTWTQFPNTIGKITNFHFFVDGTIMLCGVGKVYTLNSDYTGLIESTVLDHDGSVFVPENPNDEHHFYSLIYGNQTQYVDGVEIFFWGEYRFNGAIRMWYTVDRGRTIKCAVKFGTTVMDGAVRNIRHVHMVTQRRQDEKFYFTTGDHGENGVENMLITGKYNVADDTWAWKVLASGWLYKFGDIFFDDYYAYLLTDYTSVNERPLSGLYRVAVENLGDFSKYHAIFKPKFSDLGNGTLSRYIEDSNGNKLIFPDNAGYGRLWIARGDMNFKYHNTLSTDYVSFMNRLGANDLGDIYSNDPFTDPEPTGTMSQKLYINHGSHNLTKILRDAGLSNFMRQRALISDTWIR